jgi:5-hydroxyisourate hydrolase-like protein (transthyretin family)
MGTQGRRGVSRFYRTQACMRAVRALCGLVVLVVAVPLCFASSALATETGQIVGKVTDASTQAAITGIEVCARGTHEYVTCEPVNGSGEYALQAVPSGTYTVEFRSQYPSVNYVFQEVTGVVVAAGESREVDAAMQLGGWITGKVTDASTQAVIAGITVCVEPSDGGYLNEGYLGDKPCAETGSGGEYTVSRLPAGGYTVEFYAPSWNSLTETPSTLDLAPQFYNDKSHRAEAEEVGVRSGETTSEINAAMQPGGHIAGVVIDASTDAPIEGLQVCAIESQEPNLDHFRCATTNSSGEYTVPGLVTGEYIVEFHSPELNEPLADSIFDYAPQFYDDQTSYAQATKVPVTTGGTTPGIDAAMQPGGNITGRVTAAATGSPLKGIEVCVLPFGEEYKQNCARTNTSGEYILPQLRAGEYAVEFGGSQGENRAYAREYYSGKTLFSEAEPLSVMVGVTISNINAVMYLPGERPVIERPIITSPGSAISDSLTSAGTVTATRTPPAPTGNVSLDGSTLTVQNSGEATVKLACVGTGMCSGKLTLMANSATRRGKKGKAGKQSSNIRTIVGSAKFSIVAGKTAMVKLTLSATGRALLSADHGRLDAASLTIAELEPAPGQTQTKRVRLIEQKFHKAENGE